MAQFVVRGWPDVDSVAAIHGVAVDLIRYHPDPIPP